MCGSVTVLCPNGCNVKHLLRKDVEKHLTKCPERVYECPLCKESGKYLNIASNSHLSICPQIEVTCPNIGCDEKVIRAELKDHRKVCSHQAILCKYSHSLGCMFTALRKDQITLWQHEADSSMHLELALKNPAPPSVTIKFPTNRGTQVSKPFYMHCYKMCIVYDEANAEFRVYVLEGEYDNQLEWPIDNMQAFMEVLNQDVNIAVAHKSVVKNEVYLEYADRGKDAYSALCSAVPYDCLVLQMIIPKTPTFADWFYNDKFYIDDYVYFRLTLKKLEATGWLSTNVSV